MKTARSVVCVVALFAQFALGAGEPASLRQRALEHCSEIVFAVRSMGGDGHWYANFGHHVSSPDGMQYGPGGGQLCRLDLRTGKLEVLLNDPKGGVRDPVVSYDARKILFSYRKGDSRYYHLCETNADGTGLRQIPTGRSTRSSPSICPTGT
jgi:Tol biopolymer transport system component